MRARRRDVALFLQPVGAWAACGGCTGEEWWPDRPFDHAEAGCPVSAVVGGVDGAVYP
ncbi:Uncharacterised protein [Streptomyces griseus]|nr:hypothetical protein SAMN04490359_2098 [Streptomyces griseus]SQA26743.1 Uncharacterised protein [Streptomyces griseus]